MSIISAELYETAKGMYTELPYHNFDYHVETVLHECRVYADYCEQNGLSVNRRVLFAAGLLHDAGYHEDMSHRFSSKEQYSSYIADRVLPWYGYDPNEIDEVMAAVNGTQRGSICTTLEAKILRRADLRNVTSSVHGFLVSSFRVASELLITKNIRVVWPEFCESTREVFQDYFDEDLSFGDFDNERWLLEKTTAVKNIACLARESYDSLRTIGEATLNKLFSNDQLD